MRTTPKRGKPLKFLDKVGRFISLFHRRGKHFLIKKALRPQGSSAILGLQSLICGGLAQPAAIVLPMLRTFRKNIQSWFLKLILIGVALTFISWGAGYFSRGQQVAGTKTVATVDDMPITWGEYQQAYQRRVETYRKIFKEKLDNQMIERLKISDQALDSLIENRLLLSLARDEGFAVSDAEVLQYIEGHPAFQVGGYFNSNVYAARLQNLGLNPAQYEDSLRRLLLAEQVQQTFKDSVHVTEAELKAAYQKENEQVSTTFLYLKGEDFARGVAVDEKALETFYQEHRQQFTVPERRQVAYLAFSPSSYEKEVTLDDERLKEYYDLHIDEYRKPERVRVRHILIQLSEDASKQEDAKAKARAEALLAEARGGKDFAELAKANSEGPTASKGGDLGFFSRGRMVKPFEEAAFALEKGQVGGPVRTPFGYHVIKVEDKEPAYLKTFEEVKGDIRRVLVAEEARYLAQDAAYNTLEKIRSTDLKGADALAGRKGMEVRSTGLFSRDEPLSGLDDDAEAFRATAFGLEEGEVSNVVEGVSKSYLLALVKREPDHVSPLGEVRSKAEAAYRKQLGLQQASVEAEELAKSAKNVDDLAKAAKKLKLTTAPASTGWFTRTSSVQKVQAGPDYIMKAFALPSGSFAAVAGPEGSYVFTVTGFKGVNDKGFASARKELEGRLRQEKANSLYAAWIQRLRSIRKVEVKKEFFPDYHASNSESP